MAAPIFIALLFAECSFAGQLPPLDFSLKPRLCVLKAEENACSDILEIRWQAQTPMNLCLYQNDNRAPLTCWNQALSGTHQFMLATAQTTTFRLREPEQKWEVSQAFEVIRDHKRYRHPRRNPWNFF